MARVSSEKPKKLRDPLSLLTMAESTSRMRRHREFVEIR